MAAGQSNDTRSASPPQHHPNVLQGRRSSHRHDDEEIYDTADHIKARVMQPEEMQVAAAQFQGVLGAGVARLSEGGGGGPSSSREGCGRG